MLQIVWSCSKVQQTEVGKAEAVEALNTRLEQEEYYKLTTVYIRRGRVLQELMRLLEFGTFWKVREVCLWRHKRKNARARKLHFFKLRNLVVPHGVRATTGGYGGALGVGVRSGQGIEESGEPGTEARFGSEGAW